MRNIKGFLIWKCKERYYHKKHILRAVMTSTGVKLYNRVPFHRPNSDKIDETIISINPQDLFIGPDFLKDSYTLLNTSIADSPHRSFIQGLLDGENMLYSEYMNRLVDGKLDERPITIRPRSLAGYIAKCEERYAMVKKGDYNPVHIYRADGHYYIRDGKHRAAMCSILNVPVKCVELTEALAGGISFHMYKMIENRPEYSKNATFFKNNLKLISIH